MDDESSQVNTKEPTPQSKLQMTQNIVFKEPANAQWIKEPEDVKKPADKDGEKPKKKKGGLCACFG